MSLLTRSGDDLATSVSLANPTQRPAHAFVLVEEPFAVSAESLGEHAVIAASSHVAAEAVREITGRDCEVLTEIIDQERWIATDREPRYLTFEDPTVAQGVFAFAKIADELGKQRPDIPILVVEGEGTVAGCGLELRDRGNVFFMPQTDDPRRSLRVSRALLMPTLGWDGRGIEAVGAMLNGIPVIVSDRGALPEVVGDGGVALPLPDRLTPATA